MQTTDPSFLLLVAEDDADDAWLLEMALRKACPDWACHIVPDGAALLNYLSQRGSQPASLILLDINMPRLDGIETLKRLKNDPNWHITPVVGYSTSNDRNTTEAFLQKGGLHFFVKPPSYDDLVEMAAELRRFATVPAS
ncbi:MAG: response regulator [Cytophagales bacterium]|jgi:CheY-like chemotaxis protein|nr:response regulator [Cytophagales bacterium]